MTREEAIKILKSKMDGHIVAWMPLPEPYKAESEDTYEKAKIDI